MKRHIKVKEKVIQKTAMHLFYFSNSSSTPTIFCNLTLCLVSLCQSDLMKLSEIMPLEIGTMGAKYGTPKLLSEQTEIVAISDARIIPITPKIPEITI